MTLQPDLQFETPPHMEEESIPLHACWIQTVGVFLKRTISMQRDWAADRRIRAEALVAMLDIQLVVEDAPPEVPMASLIWSQNSGCCRFGPLIFSGPYT
jgi:hypothetical protein